MKKEPVSHELSAAEQLGALEVICRSLVAVVKERADGGVDDGISELCNQLESVDFSDLRDFAGAKPGSVPGATTHLEDLKEVLNRKDRTIIEFKTSLADLVVENRNLQKQLQALQERFSTLNTQLSQMQLHSKDVSLKYSAASKNLETREKELESANSELQELRARSYQLKNQCADYEDLLKKREQDLADSTSENTNLKKSSDKANKDLEHIANSNRQLRQSLETLEQRETELIKTIDALQREKNHIQQQLSRMLTGLNKMAVYQQPDTSDSDTSILEPQTLVPYLPFCFPERLPAAISFRREIQTRQPGSLHRRQLPPAKSFTQFSKPESAQIAMRIRSQMARMQTSLKKPFEMKFHTLHRLQSKIPLQTVYTNIRYNDDFLPHYSLPASFRILQTQSSRRVKLLTTSKHKAAKIIDNSFDLYIGYLSREIISRNYRSNEQFPMVFEEMQATEKELDNIKNPNFFIETLAFRHRFQLQSQRIKMAGASFVYSFKRGNRLKSVLEMFGNTINSMVQKYDIIATPRNGKSEPGK